MFCLLQVAGYAEIFQGMTPILGLTVSTVISTPQSDDVSIALFDNGVGKQNSRYNIIITVTSAFIRQNL